jgi:tRNA1(Val) A37 N6-methylase TrmN6
MNFPDAISMTITREERTVDAFLGGLVTLVQPKKGHRAGLDAALLQSLVPASAVGRAIDLGAGVGTVALSVAARAKAISAVGIERDPDLVACGVEALSLPQNAALAKRVQIIEGDASDLAAIAPVDRKADWVLMNPPFAPEGPSSPDVRRRAAHQSTPSLLPAWVESAKALLVPGGTLCLVHRADALAEVISALSAHFGGLRVWPVHPSEAMPASRLLATGRRGSRAPLTLMPGLVLHEPNGAWTARADAILRGRAELTP